MRIGRSSFIVIRDSYGKMYIPLTPGTLLDALWRGGLFLWGMSVGIGMTSLVFVLFLLGIGA